MGHLGELLHQRRKSLGLTLEDLQNRTKIRGKYLEAIERGDFEVIPGEVYLRGFIRSIASELGIDPGEAMQAYYQDLGQQATQVPAAAPPPTASSSVSRVTTPASESAVKAARENTPPPEAPRLAPPERSGRSNKRKRRSSAPAVIAIGLVLLLVAGAWYWATYLRTPAPPVDNPPVVDQPEPGTNQPPENPEPTVTVTLTNPGEKNPVYTVQPGPLQVALSVAGGRCWVRVTADGAVQELTLDSANPEKTTLTAAANQQLTVRVGNPAALRLTINGEDQGVLGGTEVRVVTIRAVAP